MSRKRPHHGNRRRGTHPSARKPRTYLDGTLRVIRPGVAQVQTAEGTFAVARKGLREAMNGDEVQISLVPMHGRGHEPVAYVQTVLQRACTSYLGTYSSADPLGVVTPLDARLGHDFFVLPTDDSARRLGVGEGDVVAVRILEYPTRQAAGVVTIERRVGSAAELDTGIEAIIASWGLATEFPPDVLAEVENLSVDAEAALASDPLRQDLREELCLTIDPADARDFDDAVGARELEDGGFELSVHIADVTHYVNWDSSCDIEARNRTCSVYLADRVLPMLPERLCNDVCSLRPGEDRLAMTVRMRLDAHAKVLSSEAFPSVIRSSARLSYDQVDEVLSNPAATAPASGSDAAASASTPTAGAPTPAAVASASASGDSAPASGLASASASASGDSTPVSGLAVDPASTSASVTASDASTPASTSASATVPTAGGPTHAATAGPSTPAAIDPALIPMLTLLSKIAQLRLAFRADRGAIDFATTESKVILDDHNKPIDIKLRRRTLATSLVEEAMLLANECVARKLAHSDVAAAFRVHERPAPEDLVSCLPALRELDLLKDTTTDALVAGDPFATQAILRTASKAGTGAEFLANALLLRAQKRAIYLPHNEGHYALGAAAYCHFTSPIRRYPDVIVHRALKRLLTGKLDTPESRAVERALPQLCRTCSDLERVADSASRDSQNLKMAEYYADRIGERYSGVVVGVEKFGLFVMLDDTGAEGLLPTRDLGDEWFAYDAERLCLTGESTGRTWRIGKRVAVAIANTDPARGRIDFALA